MRTWPLLPMRTSANNCLPLFAERDTECEESCARWTNLRAYYFGRSSHLLPNLKCRGIHIKQPYLLATLSAKTVDADCGQQAHLSRLEQVRSHADGWRILNVLNVIRTLRNDLVDKIWQWLIPDGSAQKISRRRTGVMFQGAHYAPCTYNNPAGCILRIAKRNAVSSLRSFRYYSIASLAMVVNFDQSAGSGLPYG